MPQQTIYLPSDVTAELEALRATRRPIPSMNAIINEIVWEGLPTDSKVRLRRERNGKSLNDD